MISFVDQQETEMVRWRPQPQSPVFGRKSRVSVKPDFSQTAYLAVLFPQSRPRGLAKGQYSPGFSGYFSLIRSSTPFKSISGKRMFDPCLTQPRAQTPAGKRQRSPSPTVNPILQEKCYSSVETRRVKEPWRPSGLMQYQNNARYLTPAERGIRKSATH